MFVVVVVQQSSEVVSDGMFGSVLSDLPSGGMFLFVGILCVLMVVLYMWYRNREELLKQKEDNLFYDYLMTVKDCQNKTVDMVNKGWIKKSFNWKWCFSVVLFWMGWLIPSDHSIPVKDLNNITLGRYRGHCDRNDGTTNILVADGRKLFLFDNLKVIKFMRGFEEERDAVVDGKKVIYVKFVSMVDMVQYNPSIHNCREIRLKCTDIESYSYFYIPHFVDDKGATINLRGAMAEKFQNINNDQNVMKVLKESNEQIAKAFKSNSELGYKQREPQEKKTLTDE